MAARRVRRLAGLVLLLMTLLAAGLVTGCSDVETLNQAVGTGADEEGRARAFVSTAAPETTTGAAPDDGATGSTRPVEPDAPFAARARAEGGTGLDADTLLAVRHGDHRGYERIVLDLGAGEEPAGAVPRWTLSSPKGDGLLRVTIPSTTATGVSDGALGDGLLRSFHVARAPEGGMFVDVFARGAFAYRVLELEDPARLVVDFQQTGRALKRPLPAVGGETVLAEPRSGDTISDPLTVSGYSRNFEAANTIVLTAADGEVLARKTVTGNDWSSTWGYFEATLDLPPFSGRGTLRVGTASARDGSFTGVEIPVRGQ